MCKKGKTIYQTARYNTNFTQEKASELLNVSPKSLGDYERGETIPPDYVVVSMANLYDAEWLGLVHLKTNNDVGKKFLPDFQIRDLSGSILDLQVGIEDTTSKQYSMASIARDNKIDSNEKAEWDKSKSTIKRLMGACLSVILATGAEQLTK